MTAGADQGETGVATIGIVAHLLANWSATMASQRLGESKEGSAMKVDRFLSPAEVAEMLQVSMRTLDRYRRAGTGPDYCRIANRVRYRQRDVTAWVRAQKVDTNTHQGLTGGRSED